MISVKVEGLKEINRALDMLEIKIGKNYMSRSLTTASKIVVETAKSRFTRGARGKNTTGKPRIQSGNLYNSIGIISRSKKHAAFRLVSPRRTGTDMGFHAHLVEYGHKKVLWGNRVGGRVGAFPFMRPAYDSTKDQVVSTFVQKFKSFLS